MAQERGAGSCEALGVTAAGLVVASTSRTGDESAGSQCSRRTDAAVERRLCWQIPPCGRDLKLLLLPPVKILPTLSTSRFKGLI